MTPRATLLICPRERHSLTELSLENVLANTPGAPVIYADIASPPPIRTYLERRAAEAGFRLVRYDDWTWPTTVRAELIGEVETEFVVFIDNDVTVEPGWLDALVACADETGAGLVGPLYLIGDGFKRSEIHMAGGALRETRDAAGAHLEEGHRMVGRPTSAADGLSRMRVDFLEYHGMLVRTALARAPGALDPAIRSMHEHVDLALFAATRGEAVLLEPSTRLTNVGYTPLSVADLPLYRTRWDLGVAEDSLAVFARKHGYVHPGLTSDSALRFVRRHYADQTLLRPDAVCDRAAVMTRGQLAQSRTDLLEQAAASGMDRGGVRLLAKAFNLALFLLDGAYRADGRPFLSHLIGTASVLVRYGFRAETAAGGLLHAAYTHAPGRHAVPAVAERLKSLDEGVDRLALDYAAKADELARSDRPVDTLTVKQAEVLAMTAANGLEMQLSGEARVTGRSDLPAGPALERLATLMEALAVPGLATALRRTASVETSDLPRFTDLERSFLCDHERFRLTPVPTRTLKVRSSRPRELAEQAG